MAVVVVVVIVVVVVVVVVAVAVVAVVVLQLVQLESGCGPIGALGQSVNGTQGGARQEAMGKQEVGGASQGTRPQVYHRICHCIFN